MVLLLRWFLVLISRCTLDSYLTNLLKFLSTSRTLASISSYDYRDTHSDAHLIYFFGSAFALRSLPALDFPLISSVSILCCDVREGGRLAWP